VRSDTAASADEPLQPKTSRSVGTRRAVLDAAAALFAERGYDTTSIDDIVKRSGISVGSIYHQFRGKSDVYLAVAAEDFERSFEAFERERSRAAAAGADPRRAYLAGAEAFLMSTWQHRNVARLTLSNHGPSDYRTLRDDNLARLHAAASSLRLAGKPPAPRSAAHAVVALTGAAAQEIVDVDSARQARKVARYFIGLIEHLIVVDDVT
jgi:AcrR family transcriptional regulator